MIEQFSMQNINLLVELGYEIHVLSNFSNAGTITNSKAENFKKKLENSNNIVVYDVEMSRNPISFNNIVSYKKIKKIINSVKFDLVHCQSPVGGVLTRLASLRARKDGTKLIYTAHGFHFYKGAPLLNWLIYYPLEMFLSRYTDVLITINREDFKNATHFYSRKLLYIPGVGVNTKKFQLTDVNFEKKRLELGFSINEFIILSVGELNDNKNHKVIIKALSQIKNSKIHYIICGIGKNREYLTKYTKKLNMNKQVHFLGYRSDIDELCKISNLFVFPSRREGLGLACLEAMASGLPILTSNIHGIKDYSSNGITGFSYSPDDADGFAEGIKYLYENPEMNERFGNYNKQFVEIFSREIVDKIMKRLYVEMSS